MKQVLLFGMALILALNVVSQEGGPFMVKNYGGVKRVNATTAGGNITVEGGESNIS